MTTDTLNDGDTLPTMGPDAPSLDRYRHIVLDGEELLVYDADGENAWLQSTNHLDLDSWR